MVQGAGGGATGAVSGSGAGRRGYTVGTMYSAGCQGVWEQEEQGPSAVLLTFTFLVKMIQHCLCIRN